MGINTLAFFLSLSSTWTLVSSFGLDTLNAKVTMNVHSNSTANPITYSGPLSCSKTIKKNVVGHTTNDPGWASWLTPLHTYENTTTDNYPLNGGSVVIPAGQAYYVYHSYSLETGGQTWVYSSSLSASIHGTPSLLPPYAVRTRYWMENNEVTQEVK